MAAQAFARVLSTPRTERACSLSERQLSAEAEPRPPRMSSRPTSHPQPHGTPRVECVLATLPDRTVTRLPSRDSSRPPRHPAPPDGAHSGSLTLTTRLLDTSRIRTAPDLCRRRRNHDHISSRMSDDQSHGPMPWRLCACTLLIVYPYCACQYPGLLTPHSCHATLTDVRGELPLSTNCPPDPSGLRPRHVTSNTTAAASASIGEADAERDG